LALESKNGEHVVVKIKNAGQVDAAQTCLAAPKARSPPSPPCELRTRESAASSFPLLSAWSTCSSTALRRAGDWEAEVSVARAGGNRSLTAAGCNWVKPKQQQGAPPRFVLIFLSLDFDRHTRGENEGSVAKHTARREYTGTSPFPRTCRRVPVVDMDRSSCACSRVGVAVE